jgi:hypothetical protein
MDFSFLKKYQIIAQDLTPQDAKAIGKFRHCFFPVAEIDIMDALHTFDLFPQELKTFYEEIGFGFFHRRKGDVNCLLDPLSLINTNLQLGYFKDDIYIQQALEFCNIETQLLFFKTQSNQYFSIDRLGMDNVNPVYYKGRQVKKSLSSFLKSCSDGQVYWEYMIKEVERNEPQKRVNEFF